MVIKEDQHWTVKVINDENDRICVKCGDKRRSTLDSEGNNGLKESKRPKFLDEYIQEKGKERGFFKPNFLQNANKLSKSNRKAPNSRVEIVNKRQFNRS